MEEINFREFINKDVRNLMETFGFKINDTWDKTSDPGMKTPGYFEFRKRINKYELNIIMQAIDQRIDFTAYYYPLKKIFGQYRFPKYAEFIKITTTNISINSQNDCFRRGLNPKDAMNIGDYFTRLLNKINFRVRECENKILK